MLGQRLRRWANIKPPLGYRLQSVHQILGVAFLQFARSLFKNFQQNFSRIIFFISPQHPWKFGEFFCVLAKLDHLACNNFFKNYSSF